MCAKPDLAATSMVADSTTMKQTACVGPVEGWCSYQAQPTQTPMPASGPEPFAEFRHWFRSLRVPSRWPRANTLLGLVLASMGCAAGNQSLTNYFLGVVPATSTQHCRRDVAIFDVGQWRQLRRIQQSPVSFWQGVLPHLMVRPTWPGNARNNRLLHHFMEEFITKPGGMFLQFGVFTGRSCNIIARRLQALGGGVVYGFDSFKGLPEKWSNAGPFGDRPQGWFKLDSLPEVEHNVELVVGYFNETLPSFVEKHLATTSAEPLQLLHLDADLYSSTRDVLMELRPYIRPGCYILIDDLLNYPGFEDAGMRALEEFFLVATDVRRIEVVLAPYTIHTQLEVASDAQDYERAVLLRIL